ncbi:MAG TPA: ATP-dependent DNA helicase RecG [Verrucomicrobiota bacterium]|nr:ATP-dependent DNA helicase RecG [Verrucomicrobiota bacterium]
MGLKDAREAAIGRGVEPQSQVSPLERPVTVLRGVGSERAALLSRLGIRSVEDLLLHRPRRYEDRRVIGRISELRLRVPGSTAGKIVAQGVKTWKRKARSVFEIILEDGTGRLHCRWWDMPYMEQYFHVGDTVLVYGKPSSMRPLTIDHPETEIIEQGEEASIHIGRIVPVYPLTEGLTQRWVRSLVWQALDRFGSEVAEPWPGMSLAGYMSRAEAVRRLHFPESLEEAETARQRLALDEFTSFQIPLQRRRRNLELNVRVLPCGGDNRLIRPFLKQLEFKLTEAQTRVLRELRSDMSGPHPMRRLLQGDVGSGKTVVAACVALMAIESGYNVAIMAPTEILAEQHAQNFRKWFGPLGVRVVLLTGSYKPGMDSENGQTRNAAPNLYVGTHALIEPAFAPDNLGLVIIDEQHKFGVAQREKLVRKGSYPHLLVMTATPIPRTLGLTIYGDLDVSVIYAEPPGRGRVRTFVRSTASLPKVWDFVSKKLNEGRQAYVVCPRIDNGDTADGIAAVMREFESVQRTLAPHKVGVLHGRLGAAEKQLVMDQFRSGILKVLVATSVIEVGVDVPNATVMVIENAEMFGLAQLHQLRGRIRRGPHEAYCILVASARTKEARERLRVLEETVDGFRVAEEDLKLRGPGEMLGVAQSGAPAFRFGDLARDLRIIEDARVRAARLVRDL